MLDAGRIGGDWRRWLLDGRRGLQGLPTRSSLEELGGFCTGQWTEIDSAY